MKILIASRVLPHHSIGGMQAVAWDLACKMAEMGHDVTLITADVPGRDEVFTENGVNVICLKGVDWRRYGRQWQQSVRKYCNLSFLASYDVIFGVSAGAVPLLIYRRRLRAVYLMQAHGTSLGEFISKWQTGRPVNFIKSIKNLVGIVKNMIAYPQYDVIVPIGAAVMRDFDRLPLSLVRQAVRILQIDNGINEADFAMDVRERNRMRSSLFSVADVKVIVTACRLDSQKGVHLSLRAFARAWRVDNGLRYLIVGDGPEMSRLKVLSNMLGVESAVHFAGAVPRSSISEYLGCSDLMVFTTTRIEGLPMNILEALASGLPCIVSDHVVKRQRVSTWVNGVNPVNEQEIANLMLSIELPRSRASLLPAEFTLDYSVRAYVDAMARFQTARAD